MQVLAGDNKFLCAQCNEKRDTLKRTCIARLPNVLFLHLKRFEFDMMEMKKVRITYTPSIYIYITHIDVHTPVCMIKKVQGGGGGGGSRFALNRRSVLCTRIVDMETKRIAMALYKSYM